MAGLAVVGTAAATTAVRSTWRPTSSASSTRRSIGGKDFERWDRGIRLRLAHIQRDNGTWRGDHCITSTSFCTAASLITLMVRPHPVKGTTAHQS